MADRVWLCDDSGSPRLRFSAGESIFAGGRGLRPGALYEFAWADPARRGAFEVLARYTTDRYGNLPNSLLVPYVGLLEEDYRAAGIDACFDSFQEGSQEVVVRLVQRHGYRAEQTLKVELACDRQPRLFASNERGQLLTGIEQGKGRVALLLRHFPAGCIRIFVVPRQFGWRAGDAIDAVRTRAGAELSLTVRHGGADSLLVPLARATELATGSYQFIARPFRPGWYLADERRLLFEDIVSDRNFASLVVRFPFHDKFDFDNGVVLAPEVAGRPLVHSPYFRFANNFPKGSDVYAALDPDALPPGLVGRKAALYVIEHKSPVQWAAGNDLQDITGPGMTPAPKIVPIVSGCVNWNSTLVWANPQKPGKYDVAVDFGNNAPNPSNFVPDAHLDPPLDMIDGYVRVGFYVTEDPSLPGPYAGAIGQHDYALGSIQVPSTDAGPTPTEILPLTATIRYPAQMSGVDAPCAARSFPLVVIMHGNSGYDTSYLGYNYLLEHLAGHGFIAMSIYAPVGVMIETRARAIIAHLGIMAQANTNPGLFQGHVDFNYVGIAGHSRGGEAVVRAARINTAEALGWQIQAGISVAPTDYYHYGDPGIPLLVIYGSNDGDVAGTWPDRTCFDIYDEAGRPRSFVFVYGATHDRFNTVWAPTALNVESDIAPSDIPSLLPMTDHENVAKGYVAAFMQAHLQGRDEQLEYFSANLKPSLAADIQIHTSHQEAGALVLDNFEQLPHAVGTNTLGGAVTETALATLTENALHTLDPHSPHVTGGAEIAWQSTAGIYLSRVPPAAQDVSSYTTLAFRVTQKYASAQNPANQPQDLYVRLTDGGGKSRRIRVSTFTDVPYPYVRGYSDLIKSAMKSARIPLASFTIANLGAQDVDLTNVESVAFEFAVGATGDIEIDDIEFSR